MTPFMCPVCNGHGTVSKPPWIAGDVYAWVGCALRTYPCPACGGTGIIWLKSEEESYVIRKNG